MKRRTTGLLAGLLTVMMGGCSFMEDRVLDFIDIAGAKFLAGKGIKIGLEWGNSIMGTEYEDFFFIGGLRRHLLPPSLVFGYYDFEKYGWQGRAAGVWRDKGFDFLGPVDRKLRVVAGNDYLFENVDEFNMLYRRAPEVANTVPLEYRQPRYHYITDIHIVMAMTVGIELYLSPWQFMDFILGWFHIDIAKDDQWNRNFDEFEDVQPPPEEFRRPEVQPETTGI